MAICVTHGISYMENIHFSYMKTTLREMPRSEIFHRPNLKRCVCDRKGRKNEVYNIRGHNDCRHSRLYPYDEADVKAERDDVYKKDSSIVLRHVPKSHGILLWYGGSDRGTVFLMIRRWTDGKEHTDM